MNALRFLSRTGLLRSLNTLASLAAAAVFCLPSIAHAQAYSVTTHSGIPGVSGTGSTPGVSFFFPYLMAQDNSGNIYVADFGNSVIRRITPGGTVSTYAGSAGQTGSTDGTTANARFKNAAGVAADSSGSIYVSDSSNHTIRKISGGNVTTLAGSAGNAGSVDGTGANARFSTPVGLVCDNAGSLYVADAANHAIRKIVIATGAVTTLAGNLGNSGSTDGTGTSARFNAPQGIAIEPGGNLLVTDYGNSTIRRVTTAGVVTTLAGFPGVQGGADGIGSAARFEQPLGIAVDGQSNTIFVTDNASHTVRRVTQDGTVTTLCGLYGGGSGAVDGTGANVRLYAPGGIIVDNTSNTLLVAEGTACTIRRITMSGTATRWLGTPGLFGSTNSTGVFKTPYGSVCDASGNLFVVDSGNHCIRKITPNGTVSVFAGNPGNSGSTNGTGTSARFNSPVGLARDTAGNLYVADFGNHTIRKISASAVVTTFAGTAGASGVVDGTGAAARFNSPSGIVVDLTSNTIFVTDFGGNTVRKISPAAAVTTVAGLAGSSGSADGTGSAALFAGPSGVTVDAAGANLYVTDTLTSIVRKITLSNSAVTTFAGLAGATGSLDGTGSASRFNGPRHLTIDATGNLYIADGNSNAIRKITPARQVSTLTGIGGGSGEADGPPGIARFVLPAGISIDSTGMLYVSDAFSHTIRQVTPSGVVKTFAGSPGTLGSSTTDAPYNEPNGVARGASGTLYIADSANHVIRRLSPDGALSVLAGLVGTSGTADGTGSTARFNTPVAVAVDSSENIYVADAFNHSIRKVNIGGTVTTVAGLSGTSGSADGMGSVARFNTPFGIAVDSDGTTIYVPDTGNHTIRKIVISSGATTTIAGQAGSATELDGTGTAARFNKPQGIAIDSASSTLFVTDWNGQTLRKITLPGLSVTTFAGAANTAGDQDGTGAGARFDHPNQCIVDSAGNIYVTDAQRQLIRKVSPTAVVTTLAGKSNNVGTADGVGDAARFWVPGGIAVDRGGVLYIADSQNHTIRKAVRASTKAQMISPANGSFLVDPVTTFKWNAGIGASGYALWIGTTSGGYDIYAGNEGTNLSRTIALPVDRKIYVTLYTIINGSYLSNSYVYDPAPSAKAILASPANGSMLSSGTLNLQWSPGIGVSGYAVWLGSSPNGYDLGAAALGAGITTWSGNVPTDGGPVYVTLWSLINGAYQSNAYWFNTAPLNAQRPAQITSHANTSTLASGNVTFGWGNAVGASGYALWVGSAPDGYDLYAGNEGTNLSKNLTLPTDGRRIYVTLHSLISGSYQSNAYWFTAANLPSPSNAAKITSHANGATFAAANTTLQWGLVAGATKYLLWVGTSPSAYDLYAGDEGLGNGKTLSMPNDGRPVYVTLYTLVNGSLLSNSYFFKCANGAAGSKPALITSPANGAGANGTTNFIWGGGSGVTSYALWVGSAPNGYDLYAGNEGVALSRVVSLPTDGRKIYVTLHSLIGGTYQPVSYQFIATGPSTLGVVNLDPGSTFTSTTAQLSWSPGATSYALWVGRSPRSYDIYAGVEGANTTKTLTNLLPNDGGPVYVTLYSLVNGVYQISENVFNAWQAP